MAGCAAERPISLRCSSCRPRASASSPNPDSRRPDCRNRRSRSEHEKRRDQAMASKLVNVSARILGERRELDRSRRRRCRRCRKTARRLRRCQPTLPCLRMQGRDPDLSVVAQDLQRYHRAGAMNAMSTLKSPRRRFFNVMCSTNGGSCGLRSRISFRSRSNSSPSDDCNSMNGAPAAQACGEQATG